MRRASLRHLALTAVLAIASPALAQDAEPDFADRIVKEQEAVRRRSIEQAMSAPARAFDHAESDPFGAVAAGEPAAAPRPKPKAPGGGFPWVLVLCLVPAVPLAMLALNAWRRSRLDGR